jgi:hypothetical protein
MKRGLLKHGADRKASAFVLVNIGDKSGSINDTFY